ncbi:MAG TPA: sulfurtransferase-like selenium metabolism protein YedF [Spirochaetota bacterium]|nr:sulfurtransferase-like selenium metabolism protein YedF [Spirochaetota bacterium]
MPHKIDAKGLACPQPVILAKKALDEHGDAIILVDNQTAVENVTRMGKSRGYTVEVKSAPGGAIEIHLSAGADAAQTAKAGNARPQSGPSVFVLSQDRMGRGDDELGYVLIKAFLHTLTEIEQLPDTLIMYNTGAKLAAEGSEVLEDLKKLEEMGVEILVCGTCANYFGLSGKIAAGKISNMYDIAGAMASSGRLVMP